MNFPHDWTSYLYLGLGIFLLMYIIIVFNALITLRNNVKKAWANIDVLLKQRHDELPKLIETCKKYMQYERSTLEQITNARSLAMQAREKGDVGMLGKAEGVLKGVLGHLFALAENYPDLKTNQTFLHLQARISELENSIADRREFYNESVTIYNIRIQQFPDIIVARLFSFGPKETLVFSAEELTDADIGKGFA